MATSTVIQSPRERILAKAMQLFYQQGYSHTGINQIIAEAGVARASFYHHFPSKEDLLLAYALETARLEITGLRADVEKLTTARERFFGPLDVLAPWLETNDFRGCPFQNMMADVPAGAVRVFDVARQHRENLRALFVELAFALKNSASAYGRLVPEALATTYLILFEGAIATAVAYRASSPIEHARQLLEQMIAS